MKLQLKSFQETTVGELLAEASAAADEVRRRSKPQALSLSSPTGSGKTVMATALMEVLHAGSSDGQGDPNATFLWLTDQPELNEQTRKKLLGSSTVFDSDKLITLDQTFDQRVLAPGNVYFLNTQRLGRNSRMTQRGDKRTYTIWQTIEETVSERPDSLWLVIDEAHRGMMETPQDRATARTIVQRLIKGDSGVRPVSLLLGISATPERFTSLLEGTTRTTRPVEVDIEEVRLSGLLKESITLYHTDASQPSDMTLLAAAAEKLKSYEEHWTDYAARSTSPEVHPLLVVQVADGTKTILTKTDLGAAIATCEGVLGSLSDAQVAHCFQDETPVKLKSRTIRHINASDIEADTNLRVVFFKMALTTGWDCPRAEVMMSFRAARDQTLIAQLVGRMVRTPLAHSVSGDEMLETVCLYLPYYDAAALGEIITKLSQADPDNGLPGLRVSRGNNLVTLKAEKSRKAAIASVGPLPCYKAYRVSRKSALRRAIALGRELAWDGLETKADVKRDFIDRLVSKLVSEYDRVKTSSGFKKRYVAAGRINVRSVSVKTGTVDLTEGELSKLKVLDSNIEQAHSESGRILGGGLHAAYVTRRHDDTGKALPELKRELWAMIHGEEVLAALEAEAESIFIAAYDKRKKEIAALADERRARYRTLRQASAKPPEESWVPPDSIEGPKDGADHKLHLYVRPKPRTFAEDGFNPMEQTVLDVELARKDLVTWIRNYDRKPWAFSLVYLKDGEYKTMYPDFLVYRKVGGTIVCDVLEPHTLSLSDSVPKAVGLATFAQEHGDEFGRIELIDEIGGELKRLSLTEPKTCGRVLTVSSDEHLRQLFEDA